MMRRLGDVPVCYKVVMRGQTEATAKAEKREG